MGEVNLILIKVFLISIQIVASTTSDDPFVRKGPSFTPTEFDLTSSETEPGLDPGRLLRVRPPNPPESLPWYTSVPVRALHESLFQKVFNLLLHKGLFFNSNASRDESSYIFKTPEVLSQEIDFSLGRKRQNESTLLRYLEQILESSPHPSHPFYLSQPGAGLDPYALSAEWLSGTVNSIPLTYYLSPVSTMMEFIMVQKLRTLIGYPHGDGDGIPTPGCSVGNIMAVNLAIHKKFPTFKEKGFIGGGIPNFRIFLSQDACASFVKAQILMGFPAAALIWIPTDSNGRLLVSHLRTELEKAVKTGRVPVMVVGTAGTRTLGAIDPMAEIAQLCEEYDVWFHVDASRSGALLSPNQKWRVGGIEKSDSVTWSWSGTMGSIHPSTFILTRRPGILFDTFGHRATYVFFAKTGLYNISYDRGDSTLQTSRRPEIIKSWFLWKSKGQKGLAAAVDFQYENLAFFVKELENEKRNGRFRSALRAYDSPMVVFNYVPLDIERLETRNMEKYTERLNEFTIDLKEKLTNHGLVHLSLLKCPRDSMYRLTVSLANTALTKADIKYLLDQIAFQAESLPLSLSPSLSPVPPPPTQFPSFVSAPIAGLHKQFYVDLFQLFLKKGLFFQNKRKDPPTRFRQPDQLLHLMDLTLGDEGLSQTDLLKEFERTIDYTPHFGHPFFVLQLMGGLDPYTVMADYVGAAMNSPMLSYEGSPATTLMETEVVEATCKLTGYRRCDGLINDGGSLSNMLGMAVARYRKYPRVKTEGNRIGRDAFVIFISEDAHYSYNKGAFSQGHGLDGIVAVKTDQRGRMMIRELKKAIQTALSEGKIPLMVGATAGTTIFGAIDPLDKIADVCAQFKLWFHVDGIYGGPLLFSEKYKGRLKGVERSDSFGLNWHKIFGGTHTMSILISRHPKIFRDALASSPVFPLDNLYDREMYDEGGAKQLLGIRKANVIKLWFLWKAKGTSGLGLHIDYVFDRANFMMGLLKATEGFELLLPEIDVLNICFYYIPKRLRGVPKDESYWNELDLIGPQLYTMLGRDGIVNIVAQNRGRNDTTFLKIPYLSSGLTDEDSKYFLQVIDSYGQDL